MKYRLNVGVMVMTQMTRPWPDSPTTVLVLADSETEFDVTGVTPVINERTSINQYAKIANTISSDSKKLEDWFQPRPNMHPEDVQRYLDILHYLDFTGYCFKEKVTEEGKLPTMIIISNDVIVDRSRWDNVSLESVKSTVLKTTQSFSEAE